MIFFRSFNLRNNSNYKSNLQTSKVQKLTSVIWLSHAKGIFTLFPKMRSVDPCWKTGVSPVSWLSTLIFASFIVNVTLRSKNRILVPILKQEFGPEKIVRYSFFWFHSTEKCLNFFIKIRKFVLLFLMVLKSLENLNTGLRSSKFFKAIF